MIHTLRRWCLARAPGAGETRIAPDGAPSVRRSLRHLLVALAIPLGLGPSLASPAAGQQSPTLRWLGHAFFLVVSPQGVRVALDPFGNIGYPMPEVVADIVTVSHEHGDHNGARRIAGSPVVLRGLKAGGAGWNPISFRMKDVRITSLPAYHDEEKGRRRGLNTIFVVEIGGLRLAHLSDIGHNLSASTVEAMGRIDVLLVPVGGNFSIDGRQAREIMTRLGPRVTIPIHYKTPATARWPIEDETTFVLGLKNVKRLNLHTVSLRPEALPSTPEIWVMRYR